MADYKFDYEAATPDSGDVMTWNTTANRMQWQGIPPIVTVPFAFNDSAEETFTYTPPTGSYISGDPGLSSMTVSGGGLIGTLSLSQGVVVGPTDGTQISLTGSAHIETLIDSDSTHNIGTSPVNDSDTDTDTVRIRVIDKVVLPAIALVTRPV
jgi:hypothetical protein